MAAERPVRAALLSCCGLCATLCSPLSTARRDDTAALPRCLALLQKHEDSAMVLPRLESIESRMCKMVRPGDKAAP